MRCVLRTIREIGGLGPELAEDFSTSFLVHAHGWKGVFALGAIARGEGPPTFADAMTQELQWSRSLTLFLLRYSRPHWSNLQASERFKLAYAQLWYPLFAFQMVIGFVYPVVALLTGTPWVRVNLAEYIVYAAAPGLVMMSLVQWVRSRGWLRPFGRARQPRSPRRAHRCRQPLVGPPPPMPVARRRRSGVSAVRARCTALRATP